MEEKLNTKTYQTISQRMATEEAACALLEGSRRDDENGCATSEDLFWKLDALQSFIRDLHWPDHDFAKHLEQRLKLMACDMIESCITRTDQAFQQWLKKGTGFVSTDYVLPSEMCAMVNVILDAKNQSFKLCAVDGVDVGYGCGRQHCWRWQHWERREGRESRDALPERKPVCACLLWKCFLAC
ncbi:calcium-dependent secretion activator-like [Scylla paramamosain]|uniref:calcium-dependent secretion activator-like n=1 Tax=Scylla paramamosain TaxID=85552 RepID=UPI003082AF9B